MHVWVEIEYAAEPPDEELKAMRRAGEALALTPKSVSVRRAKSRQGRPALVLEFEMKTQAQYKVVDGVFDTVQFYANGKLYYDMSVRFIVKPKRSLTPRPAPPPYRPPRK